MNPRQQVLLDERPRDRFLVEREAILTDPASSTAARLVAGLQIVAATFGVPGIGDLHMMGRRGESYGERLAALLDDFGLEVQPREADA